MDLTVEPSGTAVWNGRRIRCAIGRAGIVMQKHEGDGGTPAGRFAFRRVLFRPDRLSPPETGLPAVALSPADGWCDDPADTRYNRPVSLSYPARHEALWREDGVYDLIVVLGHNDSPVVPGAGSAVFLHLARPDFAPTEGCVALALDDLLAVLGEAMPGDGVAIRAREQG